MRAEVRQVRFPDVESGEPFDPSNTFQLVEVYVGAVGEAGEEQYQVTACTPAALADLLRRQPFLVGRHWLFVEEFSTAAVEAALRKLIGNVEAASRAEFVEKVGRLGLWEFEDNKS
ncbi:immunity 8 family protein [Micromonospora sp. NPDC023966]|uniref:immunity 8 family protein n=1 Tax=Micromonospora sp. NPDC023966 TaxID=3154699 RepID=UPI00340887A5